jgi:hypothetical protein
MRKDFKSGANPMTLEFTTPTPALEQAIEFSN